MDEKLKFTIAEDTLAEKHGNKFYFHVAHTRVSIQIFMDSVYIQENDRYNIIYNGMETCYFYKHSLSEQAIKYLEKFRNPKSY